jgi:secreted PhoX family phosphatase
VNEPFASILSRRLTRRGLLCSGALLGSTLLLPGTGALADAPVGSAPRAPARPASLGFRPIAGSRTDTVVVPEGYDAQLLARWGESLFDGAPSLDIARLAGGCLLEPGAAAAQERQFGYNCDALVFFALARDGRRGLLCVNHEYSNDELMFPGRRGLAREGAAALAQWCRLHPEAARVALAAHGVTVLELERPDARWRVRRGSPLGRRITGSTPVELSGPARGHALLRTAADPGGTRVLGTLGNCAGGRTPWGTYLTAEENIDDYFGGFASWRDSGRADARLLEAHRRFPLLETSPHGWEHTEARFDVRATPAEALRFGWIVEIDPRDPAASPRKRSALGRFCHEGAASAVGRDGRVAVYSGDDDVFEYLYKFVTRDRWDATRPQANRDLLDNGVLHVARFDADGTGEWLALVHGQGPLTPRAGFVDAGEVAIRARAAADLVGATPMDRPEDVEVHPHTGRVYVAFTKNQDRVAAPRDREVNGRRIDVGVDAANPRPENAFGHVLEIEEEAGDAAARRFRWNVFLLAGDPAVSDARLLSDAATLRPGRLGSQDTYYAGATDAATLAPIGCPDNLGFDPQGNLWIVTDGAQPRGDHNGAFAVPVEGADRGRLVQFMSAPAGAEVCGCEFTPDGTTLFLAVQHPGEGGTLSEPVSDWPDGGGGPPRPSVIAIRRRDGGRVGS